MARGEASSLQARMELDPVLAALPTSSNPPTLQRAVCVPLWTQAGAYRDRECCHCWHCLEIQDLETQDFEQTLILPKLQSKAGACKRKVRRAAHPSCSVRSATAATVEGHHLSQAGAGQCCALVHTHDALGIRNSSWAEAGTWCCLHVVRSIWKLQWREQR